MFRVVSAYIGLACLTRFTGWVILHTSRYTRYFTSFPVALAHIRIDTIAYVSVVVLSYALLLVVLCYTDFAAYNG